MPESIPVGMTDDLDGNIHLPVANITRADLQARVAELDRDKPELILLTYELLVGGLARRDPDTILRCCELIAKLNGWAV